MAGRNEIELLIKAKDEASAALDQVNRKVAALEGAAGPASKTLGDVESGMSGVSAATGIMTAAVVAGTVALGSFFALAQKGLKSIDDLRLAQASMASAAATNAPNESWDKIYATTGRIVEKVYELDRAFIGTGDELLMLSDSMVTFGMGIDLSTKKSQDQFVAFGNLIKMMTRGQDFQRQAYQEIRALMEGADVQGAMLVKKLEAAGVNVKAMVPEWREQGILLEKIMETLPGYLQGSKEIENTLQAQKSSLETITFKILREGMGPAYEDITGLVKGINDSLMDQNGLTETGRVLVEGLQLAWDAVKTTVQGIGWLVTATFERIKDLVTLFGAIDLSKWKTILEENARQGLVTAPIEGAWGGEMGMPGAEATKRLRALSFPEDMLAASEGTLKLPGAPGKGIDAAAAAKKAREEAAYQRRQFGPMVDALEGFYGYDRETEQAEIAYLKSLDKLREDARKKEQKELEEDTKFRLSLIADRNEAELKLEHDKVKRQKELQEEIAAIMAENIDQQLAPVHDAYATLFDGIARTTDDFFLDAFRGKLRTAGDYFEAFTDVVRQAWSRLISDMIAKKIENAFGGDIFGSLSSLLGFFGGYGYADWEGSNPVGGLVDMEMPGGGLFGLAGGGVLPGSFVPIRAFAGGGIASRPTLGMIAEAGESEAVIPLKSGRVPVELRGGRGGQTLNVNFNIVSATPRDTAQMILENRSLILGMFRHEVMNAGAMRDTIRRTI